EADRNSLFAAAGLNVGLARPVTGLAAMRLQARLGVRHGVPHDGVLELLLLFGMAGHAHVLADVIGVGGVACGLRFGGFSRCPCRTCQESGHHSDEYPGADYVMNSAHHNSSDPEN